MRSQPSAASDYSLHTPTAPPPLPFERNWLKSRLEPGSLLTYYVQTFRPALLLNPQKAAGVAICDLALNAFHDFAGRQIPLAEITKELFQRFIEWIPNNRPNCAGGCVHSLHRVLQSLDMDQFAISPLPPATKGKQLWEERRLARLEGAAAGTVPHFFLTVYRPQLLMTCSRGHLEKFVFLFLKMRACWGYDLPLSDLRMERLTELLNWLREHGTQPGGLRLYRAMLTAVWRVAHEEHLASPVPRLRGLKIPRQEPDAWSMEEMGRLIAAAGKLDRPPIAGVEAGKLWKALLLTGYWTALRRGSLLALRPGDVDLEGGWLYVTGEQMKNGRGKRFRLGEDAVAAIREVFHAGRERLFPLTRRALASHFQAIIKLARLPASRCKMGLFHKLRRTTITHTASKVGMAAASALANHSAQYVTERYIDRSFVVGHDATEWLTTIPSAVN